MKRHLLALVVFMLALSLVGCASPHEAHHAAAGFWSGLWDGLTATIAFFGNLVGLGGWGVYETINNGGWYDFGFLLGVGAFAGGSGSAVRGASR